MTAEAPSEAAADPPVSGPGARLKAARESAGLSLDQAAQQLKLAPRQVRALEDEDFEHLPGRTFTRGFVRNYARLVNLDPAELMALLPDSGQANALESPALQPTGVKIADLPRGGADAPGLGRWLIPLVLVACVMAAAAYEWYRSGAAESAAPAAVNTKPPAAKTALPRAPAAGPSPSITALPNPVAEAPKAEPAPAAQENATQPAPAAEAAPAPASSAVAAAPGEQDPAAAPAPLLLTYRGPSWTEIRDRDGTLLVSRLVPAGGEQAVRGAAPFDLVIGNASAVTLVYRGKAVDLSRYARQNVARLQLR